MLKLILTKFEGNLVAQLGWPRNCGLCTNNTFTASSLGLIFHTSGFSCLTAQSKRENHAFGVLFAGQYNLILVIWLINQNKPDPGESSLPAPPISRSFSAETSHHLRLYCVAFPWVNKIRRQSGPFLGTYLFFFYPVSQEVGRQFRESLRKSFFFFVLDNLKSSPQSFEYQSYPLSGLMELKMFLSSSAHIPEICLLLSGLLLDTPGSKPPDETQVSHSIDRVKHGKRVCRS